jgi:hypothetical protein
VLETLTPPVALASNSGRGLLTTMAICSNSLVASGYAVITSVPLDASRAVAPALSPAGKLHHNQLF